MKNILLAVIIFISALSITHAQCTQATVSITQPTTSILTICQGTPQILSGSATVASASQNGGFTYSWIKTGTTDVVLQTGTLPILSGTTTAVPSYTGITGALTDAGTYVLRVEDGNAGNAACYTEATVVLNINPATTPGVIATSQTICTGGNPAAFTVTTAASGGNGTTYTYVWEKAINGAAYSDIVGATSATYNEGVLINNGTTPKVITYRRKVTSGTSCPQVTSNLITITVNPAIVAGVIAGDQTICSGGNPVAITQTTPASGGTEVYTYQWESAVSPFAAWVSVGAGATSATYDPPAGLTATTHYRRIDASGTCATVHTNAITVTVVPALTPTVTIGVSPTTSICEGTIVTFTATPTNGGNAPTYEWYKNGVSLGPISTDAIYTTATAENNDSYYAVLTSNSTCPSLPTATSNAIVMTVTSLATPAVTLTADKTTICSGDAVTFTATQTNGGTAPEFHWVKNGVVIPSATNATYTTTTVQNYDSHTVQMTSNAACAAAAPVASNAIVITVGQTAQAAVSINADKTITCTGDPITFTATPTNGGTSPTYEWIVNGSSRGPASAAAGANIFSSASLTNGDQVSVIMTSNSTCVASPGAAFSNQIVVSVVQSITPVVTISANPPVVCSGNNVTFTATAGNGGSAPLYEWFINNVSQGAQTTSSTFTATTLTSSDVVKVILTSGYSCASPSTASATTSITVHTGISGGLIGSNQTICYNTVPASITELTAPTGTTGPLSYTWEASLDGITGYTTIPGASGPTFTFPPIPLTQDLYIRRVITDASLPAPCNTATSNNVRIIVRPQLTAGVIGSDEVICAGSAPATITEISAPAGGEGSYTYQWESSTQSGGPYANISNATNATYAPDILTVSMYFRRIETSGSCGSVTSNEVAKTVSAATATIHIDDPGQVCVGDIIVLKFQATNMGLTPIYNSYVNNNIIFSNAPGFTSTTLFEPLKSGDEVYVELISSNTCATTASSVISNKVTVDLVPCTVSTSPYTVNNVHVLMQTYVSNSVPNVSDYSYFWSITAPFVITGPSTITPGQQNVVYTVPDQADLTLQWSITGGTIVSGQNTNSVTVNWDNAVTSSTARTTSATYSLSVTASNASNQSKTTTIDITTLTTGVTQTQAQAGIKLFPNPTSGSFSIEMPESGVAVTYEILDITGLSVANGAFTSTGAEQNIDADFGAGMYQVILKYNNVVTCARLSKVQ